jgi:hypothetical protein
MRPLILLAALALTPAVAHAGVDYKCDSVNYSDQIGGWLRFGAHNDGSVELEYWNGYPPIILVDAPIASITSKGNGFELKSEADRHDATVATLELPASYQSEDSFVVKGDARYNSPENGRLKVIKVELKCVRH